MADFKRSEEPEEDKDLADDSLESDFKAEEESDLVEDQDKEELAEEEKEEFTQSEVEPRTEHRSEVVEEDFDDLRHDPDSVGAEFGPIKRPPLSQELRSGREESPRYSFSQPLTNKKSSNKKTLILVVVLLLILIGGFFLLKSQPAVKNLISQPTPTPAPTSTPAPTEVPVTLEKSEWSLEVLNGSGETGLAKKMADQIKELGYPVVKVGNAQNQNFDKSEILVRSGLEDKVELLIADLKDIIKVASFGGELKEGTAAARIIIGKDSI